mmetsp:Transcript_6015/g.11930  ORF Transcript_6015/g.11930 Transcript_6015/m.11930 type:complete len:204 (-) Transcript_6015:1431-2042(-)
MAGVASSCSRSLLSRRIRPGTDGYGMGIPHGFGGVWRGCGVSCRFRNDGSYCPPRLTAAGGRVDAVGARADGCGSFRPVARRHDPLPCQDDERECAVLRGGRAAVRIRVGGGDGCGRRRFRVPRITQLPLPQYQRHRHHVRRHLGHSGGCRRGEPEWSAIAEMEGGYPRTQCARHRLVGCACSQPWPVAPVPPALLQEPILQP